MPHYVLPPNSARPLLSKQKMDRVDSTPQSHARPCTHTYTPQKKETKTGPAGKGEAIANPLQKPAEARTPYEKMEVRGSKSGGQPLKGWGRVWWGCIVYMAAPVSPTYRQHPPTPTVCVQVATKKVVEGDEERPWHVATEGGSKHKKE